MLHYFIKSSIASLNCTWLALGPGSGIGSSGFDVARIGPSSRTDCLMFILKSFVFGLLYVLMLLRFIR